MAVYYPSAKVKLRLVLEDFGANPWKEPPSKPPQTLKGVTDKLDTLKALPDPEAPPGVTRFLLVDKDADIITRGDPALHKKDAKGLTHEIPGIIPIEADWKQNGIRAADELHFKIKWVDFPIDPRVVRACAVEYFCGCVPAEDYADGIAGKLRGLDDDGNPSGDPMNVVPDDYVDKNGKPRSNLRFQGWVDKWELDWGDGEPMVSFACRDNTQLLIKQEAPSKLVASAINDDVAIDEAIATYLKHFPQMEGLIVEYRPVRTAREDIPRLKKVLAKTAYVPELGPQQSKSGGAGEKMNVWDYLTDVCGAIGHTVRIDGTTIIIQKASTMLREKIEPRPDDPYEPRDTPDGQFPVRAMIYGRNLSKLKMSREFNKKEPANIEVRCYDPHNKTMLIARSPKDIGERIQKKLPGDKDEAKWTVLRVSGIRDKEILQTIADEAYEQLGRGELIASMETRDVWSFGGDDADPDLLDMKPTDVIEILVNRDAQYSTLTNIEKALKSQELNAVMMKRLGFASTFSTALAKTYANAGFLRAFKVREINQKWSINDGITLSIAAANFITARVEKDPKANETLAENDAFAAGKLPPVKATQGQASNANQKVIAANKPASFLANFDPADNPGLFEGGSGGDQ